MFDWVSIKYKNILNILYDKLWICNGKKKKKTIYIMAKNIILFKNILLIFCSLHCNHRS